MNLKYTGFLAAFAVTVVMAQDGQLATEVAAPATPAAVAPVQAEQQAPTKSDDKMNAIEQELAPATLFAGPSAVRGADAEQPVPRTTATKKFVYRPVYSPSEIETSGSPVKAIYVAKKTTGDTISMDELRGFIPLNFTFGLQGFIGGGFLSGDNGRYEYDRYYGLFWSVGAFAFFPIDEYNMGLKTGLLFEHSKPNNSYNDVYKETFGEWRVSFSQYRLSIPMLLSLKAAKSNIYFDVGVQPSFAVADKFKMKFSKDRSVGGKIDMMDNDCRQSVDWSIVLGLGLRANRYVGFDARFNWGLNNQYDDFDGWPVNNLTSKSFTIGVSFYAL